jgi:hypothetical protein
MQVPSYWQVSLTVRGFPSLQSAPTVTVGAGQPLAGEQAPTVWH